MYIVPICIDSTLYSDIVTYSLTLPYSVVRIGRSSTVEHRSRTISNTHFRKQFGLRLSVPFSLPVCDLRVPLYSFVNPLTVYNVFLKFGFFLNFCFAILFLSSLESGLNVLKVF